MIDVLCGLALFGIGYFIGQKKKPPAPVLMTEEQIKEEKEYRRQVDSLLNFAGRRTKPNG